MILPVLYISNSPHKGRGVFTSATIPANTTIEIAPVLVLDTRERAQVEKTLLHDYIFEWGPDGSMAAVALGYVSMYNHAIQYNCRYEMDFDALTISIITCMQVEAGNELFINYNPEGKEHSPVWFELV